MVLSSASVKLRVTTVADVGHAAVDGMDGQRVISSMIAGGGIDVDAGLELIF